MLLPQECKSVSKFRHLKISWNSQGTEPSFVAEVVGRCNGACINKTLYKESDVCVLPEPSVSCISVGLSCFMFFAPARRSLVTVNKLRMHPSSSSGADDDEYTLVPSSGAPLVLQPMSGSPVARRFPKLWSKSIIEVFQNLEKTELSQFDLVSEFIRLHASAISVYFSDNSVNIEEELWTKDLKRFVNKPPFEFDDVNWIIKFDPAAVKPRKKPREADTVDVEPHDPDAQAVDEIEG